MSSFFTLPASARKRKRTEASKHTAQKRTVSGPRKEDRDESISGSDVSDNDALVARNEGYESSTVEDEEFRDEDPAAKRIRLAEQYLADTQKEVLDVGFDAAEVDKENLRRRMGERLKEDTAESKGRLYRWVAQDLDWKRAQQSVTRSDGKSVTGIVLQGRYVYTVSKDMALSKWELPSHEASTNDGKQLGRVRTKPKRVAYRRGDRWKKSDRDYVGHVGSIMCVAVSQDGKFVTTGGVDRRIVVWEAATLKPVKVFAQHRDTVTSLAFRRGTNQLFSASRDRTVKIWSLDELAYVETLFGHQDEVVDVGALAQEKCVTVGARDRTVRLWKVVEESQLVFRGGGAPSKSKADRALKDDQDSGIDMSEQKAYNEGSIDRVTCVDDETWVTGSDNGSLSLWSVNKKKPVFIVPLAHGLEPPLPLSELSAEQDPDETAQTEPQPRWITALCAIPYSDVILSGSWDGFVRAWRITQDKRRIESLGVIGFTDHAAPEQYHAMDGLEQSQSYTRSKIIVGVINDLAIIDRGERAKDGVYVAAAVGKEHRLGRWSELPEAKNSMILFEVSRALTNRPDGGAMQDMAQRGRESPA
ncbi:hypothetical protein BAUCODRAFT_317151 [Baudoinia panamericana UAMH 10762]|uniref:Uncharacterized protein n=1 Tax=Baudoinia panamericana (strain UAMH 10762) TaxID=717646 RepID=M2MY14_BAUPA|nr:uncharacterized protein BAUCODRAFT_317151 [Baudoinia panamericana UAMH 10762]EMC91165.1 hypothetical protein BAUCODRAFT_317151 [Baudoinia panamericana UAMH 10762]